MAVGRYFRLYDPGTIRGPEYTPLPFDSIAAVGAAKQKQYDQTDEDIYNTQKMFKINADPVHSEFRDQKVAEYNNRLANIADEFHKKGEVGQLPGKIRSLARDYANDPEVVGLNENYKNYIESQKDVAKLKSEGKYDPMYDTYWGQFAKQHNPKQQGFKHFDYQGTMSTADYIKPADETMSGIAKHGFESGNYGFDKEGNIIDTKTGRKGVYEQDVRRIAKANVSSFLQNPESRYFMDRLKESNPNITPEQINAEAENLLYNRGIKQVGEETKNERSFRYGPEDKRKELQTSVVPTYDSPVTAIPGAHISEEFGIKKAGSYIPYTQEEADKMTKGLSGQGYDLAKAKIAIGKQTSTDVHTPIEELPKKAKDFAINALKYTNKDLYNKVSQGKSLSPDELKAVYPKIQEMATKVDNDVEVNSRVVGLNVKEAKDVTSQLFGSAEPTVEGLGTGSGGNLKYYDKASGETLTYSELKQKYDSKDKVQINGKFTGDNAYALKTGDDSFRAPTQLFINGNEIIVSSPKNYVDTKTGSTSNEANAQLQRTNAEADIYSAKFTGLPVEKTIHGEKTTIFFTPANQTNPEQYHVIVNGQPLPPSQSAQEAEQQILDHLIKK